ncbi:MAG: bifunctional DNA-formamidopyrimidine glycosylase/DNA-(apurinic or apyrimidinic site) lyase [Syntrophomonadaceae bacterium]|nr:bifunctional DNA-formamidopyrimidine glycosylase/DNA-(apurinic or apyrimidinic site) lyase [Syntrophomonadaceae bacterium]
MPELPEIETIRRNMLEHRGRQILSAELLREDILRRRDYEADWLAGQSLRDFRRRGKFLIAELDDICCLVFHLGMSGRFYALGEDADQKLPHVHFVLHLEEGHKLMYQDPRRFGGIWFCRDEAALFAKMGPEPLEKSFTLKYLTALVARHRTPVKNVLLNQQFIAGLGNIYVDEALFLAGIRPERAASSLTAEEIKKLHRAIRQVLQKGIEMRGTSFRDYRDGFNRPGDFQNYLQVYGKGGQPCPRCGEALQKVIIGGRGTVFCAHCQA